MALEWNSIGPGGWVTSHGLGWIEDYSEPGSPYFAMWWRSSRWHDWQEVKTRSGRRTHRSTLQGALIEVERKLASLRLREVA